jgi:hypothetical protein
MANNDDNDTDMSDIKTKKIDNKPMVKYNNGFFWHFGILIRFPPGLGSSFRASKEFGE